MKPRASLDWYYLGIVAAIAVLVVVALWDLEFLFDLRLNQSLFRWTLLAVVLAAAICEVFSESRSSYAVAALVHVVATIFLLPIVIESRFAAFGLLLVPLYGITMHNPHPISAIVASAYIAFSASILGISTRNDGTPPVETALVIASYLVAATSVLVFCGGLIRYRELFIKSRVEIERLDRLVDRLSRANIEYQEYAKAVEEESAELERKRITRDIHDIVGYTLTNNITMMEAIIDMMRVNPLGVGSLVRSARENAEEGLARIRESLHLLRDREISFPTGIAAVRKLIAVFQRGTGVRVELQDPTGVGWHFDGEVDFALYHVIQESLMNAFRHGRATTVLVILGQEFDRYRLTIRDNGMGTTDGIAEGIGLKGMRERLEKVGGTLAAASLPDGFSVIATVPKQPSIEEAPGA